MRTPVALALVTAVAAGPMLLATPAAAASGEHVAAYAINVNVQPSGTLQVREQIRYDFGGARKHGIYRYIPDKARYDKHHDRSYPTHVGPAQLNGGAVQEKVQQKGASKVIQLGDPNYTVSGVQTYTINYTIDRTLNTIDGAPQLFWNAIGAQWNVPIDNVSVTVSAPGDIGRTTCYAGSSGSRDACGSHAASGARATFTQSSLGPHQALTVVAALPAAVTAKPPLLVERTDFAYRMASDSWVWVAAAVVFLLGLGTTGGLVYRRGRDRRFVGQVPGLRPAPGQAATEEFRPILASPEGPVEFVAPKGVRPGSIGVLLDQDTDVRDVTATIVDLGVRGYLRIEEPERGTWVLVRLRDADAGLAEYEQTLFAALFEGRDRVSLDDLRYTFAKTTSLVRSEIYDDSVEQGWYARRPDLERMHWRGRAMAVAVIGVVVGLIAAFGFNAGLIGAGVVLTGAALWVASRWMPARTAVGSAAYAQALGFRRYIRVAEASQLREEEREGVFSRYLPYAIAFNEADRWVKTFDAVGAIQPGTMSGWYVGYGPFTAMYFASSLSSFTVNTGSTLVSTPAASGGSGFGGSGFGGGGFAGGGAGGGGGGSW